MVRFLVKIVLFPVSVGLFLLGYLQFLLRNDLTKFNINIKTEK